MKWTFPFPCGLFITADECFFHSITWYYGQPVSHNPGSNIPVVNQPCYKHGNDLVGLILESDHAGGKDPISISDLRLPSVCVCDHLVKRDQLSQCLELKSASTNRIFA